MPSAALPSPLARAEERLFQLGIGWWRSWKAANALDGGQRSSSLASAAGAFVAHDVVDASGCELHMVQCRRVEGPDGARAPPLVLLHGYGSGTGIYYAALPPLAEAWPGSVYALDSPGCGLSSRPRWTSGVQQCSVSAAEDWWIERLEGWRETMGIENFVLCGHSIGGYMAVACVQRPL